MAITANPSTVPAKDESRPNVPRLPEIQPGFEPRPRQAPKFQRDPDQIQRMAEYRRAVDQLRDDVKTNPRSAMISLTGWIPQPTVGLPQSRSRADAFRGKVDEASQLLEDGKREEALSVFKECASDLRCAMYEAGMSYSADKQRLADLKSSLATFGQIGDAFSKQLRSEVNLNAPGTSSPEGVACSLRLLEEINIAKGDKPSTGLETIYRTIIARKAPWLAQEPGNAPGEENAQKAHQIDLEATKAYNAAVKLFQDKSYGLAETAFQSFLKEYPQHPLKEKAHSALVASVQEQAEGSIARIKELLAYTAEIKMMHSYKLDMQEATAAFDTKIAQLSELDSLRASALMTSVAEEFYTAGSHKEAIAYYKSALELSNEKAHSQYCAYSIAVAQHEAGQNKEASQSFEDFCKKYPDAKQIGEVHLRRAHLATEAENFPLALEQYAKAIAASPSGSLRMNALHEAGNLELSHGNPAKGREYLSILLKENPQHPQAESIAALIKASASNEQFSSALELAKDPKTIGKAIAAFQTIAEQNPDSAIGEQALYRASYYSATQKDWKLVLENSTALLSQYPETQLKADIIELQAQAQLAKGMLAEASALYAELSRENPEHQRFAQWGKQLEAISAQIKVEDFNALVAEFKQGDVEKTASALDAFAKKYPDDSRLEVLRFNQGSLLAAKGAHEQALELFSSMTKSSDSNIAFRSYQAAASLHLALKQYEELSTLHANFREQTANLEQSASLTETTVKMDQYSLQSRSAQLATLDPGKDKEKFEVLISQLQTLHPDAEQTADAIRNFANHSLNQGNAALQSSDYQAAMQHYADAQKGFESAAEIYGNEVNKSQCEQDLAACRKVISAIETQETTLSKQLGISKLRSAVASEQHEDVITQAKGVLQSDPPTQWRDEALFALASAQQSLGRVDEAKASLKKLISESSSIYDPRARISLGKIYLGEGETRLAGVKFAEARALEVKEQYSDELKAEVYDCQIEALFGLLDCYTKMEAAELIASTRKALLEHPALSAKQRERLVAD